MKKIIVPVSGGKDSQACLKLAVENHGAASVLGLFCDTQFEHPLTYQHIDRLRGLYGADIVTVTGGSVLEKSVKYGRFPGGGARHCTDELKIRETRIFLKEFAQVNGPVQVWYGMRSGESAERRARYADKISTDLFPPHELMPRKYPKYLEKMGVMFMLPILDWSTAEVFDYLAGCENPLYRAGFDRVGCFPCLAAGDKYKRRAFAFDDFGRAQYARVIEIGQVINKSPFGKGQGLDCQVCAI